jgi:hypothetical protein
MERDYARTGPMFQTRTRGCRCSLEKLDVTPHIDGFQDLEDEHQAMNNLSDGHVLGRIYDSFVRMTCGGQTEKIVILGEEDPAFAPCAAQVLFVRGAEEPGFGHRQDVHSPITEALDDGSVDMLVRIEADP